MLKESLADLRNAVGAGQYINFRKNLEGVLAGDILAAGAGVEQALRNMASNDEALNSLGIPATAGDLGIFALDISTDDLGNPVDLIRDHLNYLANKEDNVQLVIIGRTDQLVNLEDVFKTVSSEELVFIPEEDFDHDQFVEDSIDKLGIDRVNVVSLRTDSEAVALDYRVAALLGLLGNAEGGLTIASRRELPGTQELTFEDVVIAVVLQATLTSQSA